MPNPIFNALGGGNIPAPMGNMAQLIQQFQQFKANFKGDPKQKVQELVRSGRITQEQLNAAQQMARQLSNFLPE